MNSIIEGQITKREQTYLEIEKIQIKLSKLDRRNINSYFTLQKELDKLWQIVNG